MIFGAKRNYFTPPVREKTYFEKATDAVYNAASYLGKSALYNLKVSAYAQSIYTPFLIAGKCARSFYNTRTFSVVSNIVGGIDRGVSETVKFMIPLTILSLIFGMNEEVTPKAAGRNIGKDMIARKTLFKAASLILPSSALTVLKVAKDYFIWLNLAMLTYAMVTAGD